MLVKTDLLRSFAAGVEELQKALEEMGDGKQNPTSRNNKIAHSQSRIPHRKEFPISANLHTRMLT